MNEKIWLPMRLPFLFYIEKVIKRRREKLISPRRKSGLAAASISAATAAIAEKSSVSAAAAAAQNQNQPQTAVVIATAVSAEKTVAVATEGGQQQKPDQGIAAAVISGIAASTATVGSS